jgi:predicted transcriptional regulator
MKQLTTKEEEIMNYFWSHGPLFVKDIVDFYPEPRPHFNTVSTIVRGLEEKGYIGHRAYGKSYQYYATVDSADMGVRSVKSIVSRYFKNSWRGLVSSLVKDEDISVEELRKLLDEVERGEKES